MYKLTQEQIEKAVFNGAYMLADYCQENDIHYVVTGSSGGLDSAVTLGFAQKACQIAKERGFVLTSVGLIMPCESKPEAEVLGREAIQKFGAEEIFIDLADVYRFVWNNVINFLNTKIEDLLRKTDGKEALEEWEWSKKIASGNIKARLRMFCGTYHVTRMLKGIVLSTDNLSEFWMAFWTLHGDVGDFGIIQQMLKGYELYDIARYLGVPQKIIEAKPDDGLGISGGDEDQLGVSYPVLDKVMVCLIRQGFNPDGPKEQLENLPKVVGVSDDIIYKLARRCLFGSFKRTGTVVLSREELGLLPIKEIEF